MCTWLHARTKLGLFLDLQELAPTFTISQHRKSQELLYLSMAVNLELQTVVNFDLKFCRMLLRSCKCMCHECKCFNVSVPFLPSMFPQRTAVMTKRVTVEVCILVIVFDLCKSIIQWCTGVTCRYQVRVFIHKKWTHFHFHTKTYRTCSTPTRKSRRFIWLPTFLGCFFPPSIPVEFSAGVHDLISNSVAYKQGHTHKSYLTELKFFVRVAMQHCIMV